MTQSYPEVITKSSHSGDYHDSKASITWVISNFIIRNCNNPIFVYISNNEGSKQHNKILYQYVNRLKIGYDSRTTLSTFCHFQVPYISIELGGKVYILLFNSCVNFRA